MPIKFLDCVLDSVWYAIKMVYDGTGTTLWLMTPEATTPFNSGWSPSIDQAFKSTNVSPLLGVLYRIRNPLHHGLGSRAVFHLAKLQYVTPPTTNWQEAGEV